MYLDIKSLLRKQRSGINVTRISNVIYRSVYR